MADEKRGEARVADAPKPSAASAFHKHLETATQFPLLSRADYALAELIAAHAELEENPLDETIIGGRYRVGDQYVDCAGVAIKEKPPRE